MNKPNKVYVDVVCDLFHPGHLAFFAKARTFGRELVVGVLSDDSVATYKRTPILTLAERVTMLEQCRLVDQVIPDAPLFCTCDFLDRIGAQYVCHANDLSAEQIQYWYKDVIPSGRLKVVDYTAGISTSAIIERVIARNRAC
jgi:cytidyltransferase-like protein